MNYFKFSTYTTQYYFPKINKETKFLYKLYSPYNSLKAKVYWYLFRNSYCLRYFNKISKLELPSKLLLILNIEQDKSLMSFNMGTPGEEQKVSILGYDKETQRKFFAKFS